MSSLALIAMLQISTLGAQETDYALAYRQSMETGRPLVVLVGATWCPACVQMKESILPEVAKAGGMNQVAFAYVDFDEQQELAARLIRTQSLPQLVRLDRAGTGWNRRILVGAKSPSEVYSFLNAQPVAMNDQVNRRPQLRQLEEVSNPSQWTRYLSAMNPFSKNHTGETARVPSALGSN